MGAVTVTNNRVAEYFRSGKFVQIPSVVLQTKYEISIVPCQLWESTDGTKLLLGLCPKSLQGTDYGANKAMLEFMRNAFEKGKAKRCLVMYVTVDPKTRAIITVDGQIPLAEALAKLDGITPIEGQFGAYFWVDVQGNSTRLSYANAPAGDVTRDDF